MATDNTMDMDEEVTLDEGLDALKYVASTKAAKVVAIGLLGLMGVAGCNKVCNEVSDALRKPTTVQTASVHKHKKNIHKHNLNRQKGLDELRNDYVHAMAVLNAQESTYSNQMRDVRELKFESAGHGVKSIFGGIADGIKYHDRNARSSKRHDHRSIERIGGHLGDLVIDGSVFNDSDRAMKYLNQRICEVQGDKVAIENAYARDISDGKADDAGLMARLDAINASNLRLKSGRGYRGKKSRGLIKRGRGYN